MHGSRKYDKSKVKFVYAGAITEEKGVLVLLKAFLRLYSKSMGKHELHLYGSCSDVCKQALSGSWGVENHGVVENARLRKELVEYDVFVFPSKYDNEGHPGAIIEALMAGLPVISSDLTPILEIVRDNVNGIVVPVGDDYALFSAMDRMANDEALRRKLSFNALKTGEQFDEDVVLPLLTGLLGFSKNV